MNVSRNFRIKEGINLNIRVEFQNAFNRTRLPQPTSGGAFGVAYTAPVTNAGGLINGGYGTVVPISGTMGQRTGLFIGRLDVLNARNPLFQKTAPSLKSSGAVLCFEKLSHHQFAKLLELLHPVAPSL